MPASLSAALLVPALAVAPGCDRAKSAPPAPPPPAVTVSRPVVREVVEWDEFNGRLEAVEAVDLRARVGGLLVSAPFQEGSVVEKGAVLFEIDPRPFQAELDRARGEVGRVRAEVERSRSEFARIKNLQPTGAVTEQEFVNAEQALREAQASEVSAQGALEAARLNVEFTKVTAPITGRIGRKIVTPGNLITGGTAGATLLTTIVSLDPIYCYVDADERSILKYNRLSREKKRVSARDAQIPAFLALADESDFSRKGVVDFVANRLDPGTGTLQARAVFPNPSRELTPGLFARLRVEGSAREEKLLVSDAAVGTDQGQKFVVVVDAGNVAEQRPVKTGALFGGLRAVESGLGAGEWVVVNGLQRVRSGAKVDPTQAPMPARAARADGGAVPGPVTGAAPAALQGSATRPVPATRPVSTAQ